MALYESLKSHCFGIYSIFLLGCCTSWRNSPLQSMGDGKKNYTRAVGIIMLKGYLAVLQRSFTYSMQTGVCGVQHRCLVSKRHGRRQLYVSGMQVFQLVFTLSTGKQIFFFFFPLVEEEETVGGKERRGITHSHFPEWKGRGAQPLFTHTIGSAFLCKYKSTGTDLGCFSLSCEDSLFIFDLWGLC